MKDIERYMQIFRRDMETFFELMKAEDKVLLEKICKGTENRARTVLEDTEEKKTLTLSDPDNSCGKEAYDTQTLHANNEARNDEIRVGGNDGVGGDRVRGDGVGGDRNKVVVGAENSIRKFNKGAENCIWKKNEYETTEKHHIFVLDEGGGSMLM